MNAPLLLVGHGTAVPAGAAQFHDLAARLRRLTAGRFPVAGGFLELSKPPVEAALDELRPPAAGDLVALPLMLLGAGHAKRDIPQLLRELAEARGGLTIRYGRPLGPHPTLLGLLTERIDAALAGAGRAGTTVVLAGQGSTDPEGNADLAKVSRLLWEGSGFDAVETAYLSTTTPALPDALERAHRLRARRIVIAPHLLFQGVLSARIQRQAAEWAAGHPEVTLAVADVIGDCHAMAELILERYTEALSSGIVLR